MGFGVITGGGTNGLYTVSLDYGSSVRDAMVAARTARAAELDAEAVTVGAELTLAQADTAAAAAVMNLAIDTYADALNGIPAGTPEEVAANLVEARQALLLAQSALTLARGAETVPRIKLQMLRERSRQLRVEAGALSVAALSETRSAWCLDLTEDGSGEVAVVEIPGEPSAVLIAAGCAPWTPADGVMTAREIMSPEQVFFNAAILPGWQKFKPTYRKGTITALDTDADTASVDLDAATSTANSLGINQASTLVDVPVQYMACNANAFEIGDRCVVQFEGQSQTSPVVVGFVDNPRPCNWICRYYSGGVYYIVCSDTASIDSLMSDSLDIRASKNGGGTITLDQEREYIGTALESVFWSSSIRYWGGDYYFVSSVETAHIRAHFLRDFLLAGVVQPLVLILSIDFPVAGDPQDFDVWELAFRSGGELLLNIAFQSLTKAGGAGDRTGYIKTPGGIILATGSEVAIPLSFTLTGLP